MKDVIKAHYKDEDILRLNLCTDINKWKSEVNFIDIENVFYIKFLSSSLVEESGISEKNIHFLQKELENLQEKNTHFSSRLQDFVNELEGMKECEDLQCETFYLNNHQQFKIKIENYFFENRKLKTMIYSNLDEVFKKFR